MTTSASDRDRIAARYPARPGTHAAYLALVTVLGLVLVGWMTWAGLHGSKKPVTADVHGFTVPSDTEARATLRLQRDAPATPVLCTIDATAENFVKVGERDVAITAGTDKITMVDGSLKTVNRATTVTVVGCRAA